MSYKLHQTDGRVIAESETSPVYNPARAAWETLSGAAYADPNQEYVVTYYPPAITKVSPVEFKLLFTTEERVAIKLARVGDAAVEDFFSLIEDPRLKEVNLALQSTQDALAYLVAKGLLTPARMSEILTGQFN